MPLSHAENRIYYSIFYIVSALAMQYNFSTSKHMELLGWFNKNFVFTGKVSIEMKNIYKDAFENRQESDYEDYKTFEIDEVKTHFDRMIEFVKTIEHLIKEKNESD
ncbi:MAG: HEPN domain-containing protein [Ignavibacteriaceae bacterium]